MICYDTPAVVREEREGRGGRAGTLRQLANRVLETAGGRRTGAAPTATTGQILRQSPLGRAARNLLRRRRGA